jgi:hypothetical protein
MAWVWLLIVVVFVAALAAVAAAVLMRKRRERSAQLRERFGPEYDRAVKDGGGRRAGEAELEARMQRHRELQLSPIDDPDRARFEEEWREIDDQFDDAELAALARADALTTTVLAARGYPMESFDQRAADLSVDYSQEVGHYRRAHAAYRLADDGEGTREDLYEALQHYRALLDALLETDFSGADEASGDVREQRPPRTIQKPAERRTGGYQ